MIKIICIGKVKEKFYREAIDEYLKRLQKYDKMEIIELKDENLMDDEANLIEEGKRILSRINANDYLIALDVLSKELNSEEFASQIELLRNESKKICFVIGGSNGLSKEVRDRANEKISFSKMTFPHQLFRIILLEQIYRSFKINNNETYHK